MKHITFVLFLTFIPFLYCQTGGQNSFAFLNLPFNARSAALGNDFLSAKDEDLNLGIQNPSLYNEQMHNMFGYNHAYLASGINYGMLTYGKKLSEKLSGVANLRYVNYGNMERRDAAGKSEGKFYAGDFVIGTGVAKQLNPLISVGANLNLIYSQQAELSSFGFGVDLAGSYELKERNLFMTALVKNAGYQVKAFSKGTKASLPTEFQFAIAHKLKHAPFRFTLLVHHLNKFDLTYVDPNLKPKTDPLTGELIPLKVPGFGEKIFRHFTYQVELLLTKNLHFRTAFDYNLRQDLKVAQKPGVSGFSFGLGLKFKRFSLDYAIVTYSAAGYNNLITLNTNFDKFKK